MIKTGGKQYLVSPDKKIKIEKLDKKEGDEVVFSEVLLLEKQNRLEIGTPLVKGVKVIGRVVSQGKYDKLIAFKFKAKTRRRVKKGHRQAFTEVKIEKIESAA